MKHLNFVTQALGREVWAITPDALEQLRHLVDASATGPPDTALQASAGPAAERQPISQDTTGQQIAIVNLQGTVISRAPAWASYYGIISPQAFAIQMRELADDESVAAIVIWAESPGGTVSGTIDAAEGVAYAASKKKVVAVASDMAASAAYWIISQATEVVATPTSLVGSIGVITSHVDMSGYYKDMGVVVTYIRSAVKKALGQSTEPLSKAARDERQRMVDDLHIQFVQAVASGRQVEVNVAAGWATGEIWVGQGAVTAGLADRVASLRQVLAELTGNGAPPDGDFGSDDDDDDWAKANATTTRAASSDAPPGEAEQNQAKSDDAPPPSGAVATPPPSPSQEEPSMNIAAISAKLAANQALTAEESAFLQARLNQTPVAAATPDPAATSTAAQPDTSAWPAEARAAFEGLSARLSATDARAVAAEQSATAERNIRLTGHFEQRAQALGQPTEFAATLRAAHDKLSKEEYEAYESALNRGAAAASGLLDGRGSG